MKSALGEVVQNILSYDKSLEIDPLKVSGCYIEEEEEGKGGRGRKRDMLECMSTFLICPGVP